MSSDNPQTLGEWALWYAENGFGVFPVEAGGKRPAPEATHGVNDWTDNPDDIRAYWGAHPRANVGIACGTPSGGLLVIDLDVSDEKDGLHTLKEWEAVNGELPETATAITGGGGRHLLYRTDRTNIRPSTNPELGVDVRCDGSYIVAPPSVHPSGNLYEWWADPRDVGIATADGHVYDFLDHVQRNGGRDETHKDNGKFRLPEKIKRGERDDTLFRYAAHLRAIGRSDDEMLDAVAGANALRCEPPLDSRDVERIVRSACRYDRGSDGGAASDKEVGAPGRGKAVPSPDVAAELIYDSKHRLLHDKLAQLLVKSNHACIMDGAPAIWTGQRWRFGTKAIDRVAYSYAPESTGDKRKEVIRTVMVSAPEVSSERWFDGRYYVQFSNVTYDVLADEVVEPRPEMLIIGTLPVDLDLDAPPGLADEFLSSIAKGDAGVKRVLCEIIGCCMCASHIVSKAPMLVGRANGGTGKAANGKSTFIDFVEHIIGSENKSRLSIDDMGNRFNKGMVEGKLANLGDDISDGYLKGDQLSVFKKMVTGDEMFTDVKGLDGYTFRPYATQVFSMNAVPRMSDVTEGIWRRLAFVPFYNSFKPGQPGFDPDIGHKLAQDENLRRGALLGLMSLRGLIERRDFTPIPAMQAEVERARVDNSSVARWATENDETAQTLDGCTVGEVYRRYRDWADDAGERFPRANNTFSSELMDFLAITAGDGSTLKVSKTHINGKQVRVYRLVHFQG